MLAGREEGPGGEAARALTIRMWRDALKGRCKVLLGKHSAKVWPHPHRGMCECAPSVVAVCRPCACAALMMPFAQVLAAVSQCADASVRQEAADELSGLLDQPLATWAAGAGYMEKKH